MNNTIKIKNIFYMLSYAFGVLKQNNFKMIASEEFNKIEDLFAEILSQGVSQQLKQGLYKEYVSNNDNLITLKGKVNLQKTIKNQINNHLNINCDFDELTENNLYNQIIKSSLKMLINVGTVDLSRKQKIKKLLLFFDSVDTIDLDIVSWNRMKFHKNNRNYEMLLNICYFLYEGIIHSHSNGQYKMLDFSDEHMEKLYEKFILEYYRQEHKELIVTSPYISWNLTDEVDDTIIKFLPRMKSDVMLQNKDKTKTLIIDAKYYSRTMQEHYNKHVFYSQNLYQIFTYVKNYDVSKKENVRGLLLYAKSDVDIVGLYDYPIDGNIISIRTLDLNNKLKFIVKNLDEIIEKYF